MDIEQPRWMVRLNDTPLGHLDLYFSSQGLTALGIVDEEEDFSFIIPGLTYSSGEEKPPGRIEEEINEALGELIKYSRGVKTSFSKIRLDPKGSAFQLRVWQELRKIPWGETITYQELAHRIGRPDAVRAVGQACGANPLPVVIPCHRVVSSDGSLGGYSSGLEHKRWLLNHEGAAKREKGERTKRRKSY